MNIQTIAAVMFVTGIVLSVGATAWYIARQRFDQKPFSIDFLAQQARPRGKVFNYLQLFAALCVVAAFFAFYMADPKGMRPLLGAFAIAIMLLSQLVQQVCQRLRALEAIIRLSLPD